ncbi:hypothetical protein CQW23_02122 [Capsicum baccatum]|uniref:Uncharacterized protein n=1 Tax=Capsicum baccatum TaxID=33114 RepID=A0A2G2XQN0_CAPBA|nr:hypothetical protein CQW23_02122 [Capsicum baccatum]
MFLSSLSIEKKPDDIVFNLIEFAIYVGQYKYPVQFEKRKNKIIKMLLYPDKDDFTEDEEEEEDDTSTLDEKEDCVTLKKKNKSLSRLLCLQSRNRHSSTRQQSRNTSMGSRKSNVPTQVVSPRRVKLLSDFSFEKQLDGDNQLKKQNHKGFKKIDTAPEKKREEQKECTSGLNKSMLPPLMKMNNEATKKHNCCSITRPMQRSAVARPKQKETENISDMKKFESSKKKFEERFTEQKESKRRIVMVDFQLM